MIIARGSDEGYVTHAGLSVLGKKDVPIANLHTTLLCKALAEVKMVSDYASVNRGHVR